MKKIILSICLLFFVCCNTETKESSKTENDLTSLHLKGKVKEYSSDTFEVESYKFGEPQFELSSSKTKVFNPFGFIEKTNSVYHYEYSTSNYETSIDYLDSVNGIRSKRTYKSDGSDVVNIFQYDSISKKLTKVKTIDKKDNTTTIRTYEYEKGIEREYHYDESDELDLLRITKYDDKSNFLEMVEYDKDGFEIDEWYIYFFNDGSRKDSLVNRFSSDRKIYSITTTLFDNTERIINKTTYDDGKLDDVYGYYIEYDESNYNSSFNEFKFKRNIEVVLEKFRITKKLDDMGNVSEEVKLNLNNNKIVEKTIFSYEYFPN